MAVITTLVGVLQLGAIGLQVRIAKRQNQIIEKQNTIMTGQSAAADKQSDYMRDGLAETRVSNVATQRAVQVIERAYIDTTRWRLHIHPSNAQATVHYHVINTGRTPAYLIERGYNARVGTTPPTGEPAYRLPFENMTGVTILPNLKYDGATDLVTISKSEWEAVRDKTKEDTLWLWGFVRYKDAFGTNRVVKFLFRYEKDRGLAVHPTHGYNYSD